MHKKPTTTPSLDELNQSDVPAFLWDGGRRRVIWANSPGIHFFAADSLFDLIERRFGAGDAGASGLGDVAGEIQVGEMREEELSFASANGGQAIACHCYGHHLPDGRVGVLVVARSMDTQKSATQISQATIDALPHGVITLSDNGEITSQNVAARELFSDNALSDLATLLDNDERAREVLEEASTAGIFSRVMQFATKFGLRDFRVHVQSLASAEDEGEAATAFLATLDDVTERRALQLQLQEENKALAEYTAAVADFTWEVDGDLNFTQISGDIEAATGIAPGQIAGQNWHAVAEEFGLDPDGNIASLFAEGAPWRKTVNWANDGESVSLTLSAVPIRSLTGEHTGYRGIAVRSAAQPAPETEDKDTTNGHWRAAEKQALEAYAGKSEETPKAAEKAIEDEPRQPEGAAVEVELTHVGDEASNETVAESETPSGKLTPEEEEAFRTLGETLSGEIKFVTISAGDEPQPVAEPAPETDTVPELEEQVLFAQPASAPADEIAEEDETENAREIAAGIIDGLQAALLVHRDGTLLHVNPFAAALLGYQSTEDALRAENLKRVFGVYADDLLEPGREIAFTSVPLDSEPIRLNAYSSAITWPGGGAVQICLEKDNEAAKAAPVEVEVEKEQATPPAQPSSAPLGDDDLRTMLNTATDGIITLDGSGTILALNASAEALFGYNSAELLGKPLSGVLAEDGGAILSSYIADLTEGGIASAFNDGREVIGVEKNGGEIPMFLTLGPLPAQVSDEEGASSRFCAVLRDLTTWKKTEADLRKGKEVAERANAQKSEFLANISHELRTPLNAIIGFSEVMKSRKFGDISNARYSGYINDIHSSGEHLLSLINDLLDLSKIEAGKLELNFTSVRLEDVIAQSMALVQDQARDGRVVVRTSLQADLPDVVADQRAMRQIVLNLLSNAIKFTAPGGQVAISGKLKDSGEVRLKIKDTGRGMSAKELQKAMQPFMQVEDAGSAEGAGTGLGLPLTKALTEANRARFSISSEPDKGTLVTITFPVTRVLAE